MTVSSGDNVEPALFRILISSDIHLGYGEKDPERANDSFNTFDEILGIGEKEDVDLVLLGGDLFHENKPSRSAEIKCMQSLRNYVLGDKPVQFEYLSNPEVDFAHCNSKTVNYESPNLNVALPVFSIHGNHDDPSGIGGHSCLDLIHEAGLINYFGKVPDLKYIKIRPILLQKGDVKIALYGLSNVKDERLHRLFRENKVEFATPKDRPESWFNILVLHQNRAKRSTTNYIPENFLPEFFHLVIWGHEHDCRLEPEASEKDFFVSQPGSPCATSLCEGEAIQKKVGILNIRRMGDETKFKMVPVPLQTVRPLIFRQISITDLKNVDLTEPDPKVLNEAIYRCVKYEVEDMLEEAGNLLTGHPKQGKRPLLRLRVEYTDESQQLNSARFGNEFMEKVSNHSEILLFKKRPAERKSKADVIDTEAMDETSTENTTLEDFVKEYFNNQTDSKRQLSLLKVIDVGGAVKSYVEKDDKDSLKLVIDKSMDVNLAKILSRGDETEEVVEEVDIDDDDDRTDRVDSRSRSKAVVQQKKSKTRDELFSSEEDSDILSAALEEDTAPRRGRGRGRGRARAALPVTTRGRTKTTPVKRGGRGRAAGQATIAQAFSRSQTSGSQLSATQSGRPNKKQAFISDSDDE